MLEVIYIIASKDANLYRETLCIPKRYFPDSFHFISKTNLGQHKPKGWEFNLHLYNAVDFIECIEDWGYTIHLCIEAADINQHLIKFIPSQCESNMYNLNNCFKNKIANWENYTEGISLHKEDLMQN